MGAIIAAGSLLIAYSPVAVLLLAYAARRSALLVLTIASAFGWLLSIVLASLVWLAIPMLKETHVFTIVVSCVCQEGMRWLVVWAYVFAETRIEAMAAKSGAARYGAPRAGAVPPPLVFNDLAASLACGLGFGAMHAVMAYGAVLVTAVNTEAAFYLPGCPQVSGYVLTAGTAMLTSLLHVALHVAATETWRKWPRRAVGGDGTTGPRWRAEGARREVALAPTWENWVRGAAPLLLHLAFSLVSLMNGSSACRATLPLQACVVLAAVAAAVLCVRSPGYSGRRAVAAVEDAVSGGSGGAWTALPPTPNDSGRVRRAGSD